jgi:hypothetical protein
MEYTGHSGLPHDGVSPCFGLRNFGRATRSSLFWMTVNALQKQFEKTRSELAPGSPTTPVSLLLWFAHRPQ